MPTLDYFSIEKKRLPQGKTSKHNNEFNGKSHQMNSLNKQAKKSESA